MTNEDQVEIGPTIKRDNEDEHKAEVKRNNHADKHKSKLPHSLKTS